MQTMADSYLDKAVLASIEMCGKDEQQWVLCASMLDLFDCRYNEPSYIVVWGRYVDSFENTRRWTAQSTYRIVVKQWEHFD